MIGLVCAVYGEHVVENTVDEDFLETEPLKYESVHEDSFNVDPVDEDPEHRYDDSFLRRLKEGEEQLYPGCTEFSKLSFILELYQLKCDNHWSDKSFQKLLSIMRRAIPNGESTIPKTMYHAKSVVRDLGLNYTKIDACRNDCILYRNEYADVETCPNC